MLVTNFLAPAFFISINVILTVFRENRQQVVVSSPRLTNQTRQLSCDLEQ